MCIRDRRDTAPSFTPIKKLAAEFKCGHTSLKDDPCSGCLKSVTTPKTSVKCTILFWQIAVLRYLKLLRLGISCERTHHVVTEELNMRKLSTRWCRICYELSKTHSNGSFLENF